MAGCGGNDYYPFGMLQPGREYNEPGSGGYRYGFNGQEHSDEIKGGGNSYTAQFWEYDPRLGRRWNVDPKTKVWESPYVCFSGNPILRNDVNGDTDSTGPKPKTAAGKIIAKTSITIGENGVTTFNKNDPANPHKGSTLIASLFGGAKPYGSALAGGADEPNSFIQLLYSLLDDGSLEFGLHWMKNKIEAFASGLKDEAPTTLDAIAGRRFKEINLGKSFKVSGSAYAGAGLLLAAPIPSGNGQLVNPPPVVANLGDPYRVVGLSQVLISRVDFTYRNRVSIFVAATIHNMVTFAQKTTNEKEPVHDFALASVAAGIKVRL